MAITGLKPKDLYTRVTEGDLVAWRGFRVQTMQDWKARLVQVDRIARGEWTESFSDQTAQVENPLVMNMVDVGLRDIAKLVSEAQAAVRCYPDKDTHRGDIDAVMRQTVADGYWEFGNGEVLVPRLAMDLAGAGMAAIAAYVDEDDEYPCFVRLDPRFCYPDVRNGRIMDMLVVEEMNLRTAAREFPKLGLNDDPTIVNNKIEILTYYGIDEVVQCAMWRNTDLNGDSRIQAEIVARWATKGVLTVAFAQLDAFDSQMHGMFDQMGGSLYTKNRIVKQLMDYTDEIVYSPRLSSGILNPDEPFSPDTHYRMDPNVPHAMMGRVPPAATAPQVMQIMEFLDREQRGAAGYPASRQGEVSQAIASASFVNSTQGQLTSEVRNIQRLIAMLRQDLNKILYQLDEKFMDFEKPMLHPVSTKTTYTPSAAIHGNYRSRVMYGAGAGLDRLNADVRILQLLGANVISLETARENIDFIDDPDDESKDVEVQQTVGALMQKFMNEADIPSLLKVLDMQANQGMTLAQALTELAKQTAAAAPAAAPAAPGAEGAPAAPEDAAAQAQALQAGGMPQGAPAPAQPIEMPRPPLDQISVSQPGASRTVQLR